VNLKVVVLGPIDPRDRVAAHKLFPSQGTEGTAPEEQVWDPGGLVLPLDDPPLVGYPSHPSPQERVLHQHADDSLDLEPAFPVFLVQILEVPGQCLREIVGRREREITVANRHFGQVVLQLRRQRTGWIDRRHRPERGRVDEAIEFACQQRDGSAPLVAQVEGDQRRPLGQDADWQVVDVHTRLVFGERDAFGNREIEAGPHPDGEPVGEIHRVHATMQPGAVRQQRRVQRCDLDQAPPKRRQSVLSFRHRTGRA
jgi:hypothetical protein